MLAHVCIKRFPLISEVTVRGTHVHCVFYHVSGITLMSGPRFFRHVILSHWKKKKLSKQWQCSQNTVCYGEIMCWTWMFWEKFHSFWGRKIVFKGTGKCDYCENFWLTLKWKQKHIFYVSQICDTFCMLYMSQRYLFDIWGCVYSMNLVSAWTFCKVYKIFVQWKCWVMLLQVAVS